MLLSYRRIAYTVSYMTAAKKPKAQITPQSKLVHMRLSLSILDRLDDFRFNQRLDSRSEAARWLLVWALDQKPSVPKNRR